MSKYVVLIDPLDGSSNIDVNVSVGTIFSIYRRVTEPGTPVQPKDFLQKGVNQIAAGYVVYGSSTLIVLALLPVHPNIKFPRQKEESTYKRRNYIKFPQGVKDYLKYCQKEEDDRPYTSRYIGSLVSDFHRNMLKGGIYIYPSTSQSPQGKLRLLYECNPMAFLAEQSGGKASDGFKRILEIEPTELHQRVPFFCGSAAMMVGSILSILQMPGGIPVATVALNGALNAGILAAKIIGSTDDVIVRKLQQYQESLKDKVLGTVDVIKKQHPNDYDQ
ncbi:hypothetical protein FQR65_LT19570 [Abscondita terminalis]|nr:hypothetical protein FQR65_LT19570 [Abscondita terminalis]